MDTRTITVSDNHEMVDLGLPSGLRWASCNICASRPEEYGEYFSWGEGFPKDDYSLVHYKWWNDRVSLADRLKYNKDDGLTTLEADDDTATLQWGNGWRMPTKDEFRELLDFCKWSWTSRGGINGYTVVGPNGNSIFLPAAGFHMDTRLIRPGEEGAYWSSTLGDTPSVLASQLGFKQDGHYPIETYRDYGYSIRPVFG